MPAGAERELGSERLIGVRHAGAGCLALPLAAMLLLAGCDSGRPVYPVHGRVVFEDGTPMVDGTVEFESIEDERTRVNASGEIQPDGSFTLTTREPGDGAVEGKHRAIVVPPLPVDTATGRAARSPIHPKYRSYETSGLVFEVSPGENHLTIEVEKPANQE